MAKDETAATTTEEPTKKGKGKLIIMIVLAIVLLGGGAGAYLMLSGSKAEAAPVKGSVVTMEDPLTINLADAHYLKIGFAIQLTEDGPEEFDTAEALDIAIEIYTGKTVAELSTEHGREEAKAELLKAMEKAYNVDGTKIVMGVYFTSFVTQ